MSASEGKKCCSGGCKRQYLVGIVADDPRFIPQYQTDGAAGADLRSSVDVVLKPHEVYTVDCGFSCEIPTGYHAKITARSSMGKKGIIVTNAPGIIDSDYRGRICVLLMNLGKEDYQISVGDKIAQWLIEPVYKLPHVLAESLSETARGTGGFGSTGKN